MIYLAHMLRRIGDALFLLDSNVRQVQLKLNKCSKLFKSVELVRPFEIEHPDIVLILMRGALFGIFFLQVPDEGERLNAQHHAMKF